MNTAFSYDVYLIENNLVKCSVDEKADTVVQSELNSFSVTFYLIPFLQVPAQA